MNLCITFMFNIRICIYYDIKSTNHQGTKTVYFLDYKAFYARQGNMIHHAVASYVLRPFTL